MAKPTNWSDEYWLLLLQLYLSRPVGVKPAYSRPMVDLSLELHVHPQVLHERMIAIARLDTPRVEHIWRTYGNNPRRLARAVKMIRSMNGFNNAGDFYDGVDTCETFELDFRPIDGCDGLTPVVLILTLDLYFRLVPDTMVAATPEVVALARLTSTPVETIVKVMACFRNHDPYYSRYVGRPASETDGTPLDAACRSVWLRFGNGNPEELATFAKELEEYYRKIKN